jgi:hypothetical protein
MQVQILHSTKRIEAISIQCAYNFHGTKLAIFSVQIYALEHYDVHKKRYTKVIKLFIISLHPTMRLTDNQIIIQ